MQRRVIPILIGILAIVIIAEVIFAVRIAVETKQLEESYQYQLTKKDYLEDALEKWQQVRDQQEKDFQEKIQELSGKLPGLEQQLSAVQGEVSALTTNNNDLAAQLSQRLERIAALKN